MIDLESGENRQNMRFSFLFFLILYSAAFSQTPTPAPSGPTSEQLQRATADGEATGAAIGQNVSTTIQNGLTTQQTDYNTLQRSSVDSMMNAQLGEATSISMSNSLTTAALPYANDCDPNTIAGTEACATGSVLAGMSGQMQVSTSSFQGPINTAWRNACHFSHYGCANLPANPYVELIPRPVNTTAPSLPEVIQTLRDRGYMVDARTGMVTLRDGTTFNVNDQQGVQKALGEGGSKNLARILSRMQKDISSRFAKLTSRDYMKLIGMGSLKNFGQKVVDQFSAGKDKQQEEYSGRHYNRLPEKIRENVQLSDLVKNYKGTPIGVAAADIFKMIKKRYNIKASEKVFLSPEVKVYHQSQLGQ